MNGIKNKERICAYNREKYIKNSRYFLEKGKHWRKNNSEKYEEYRKKWRTTSPVGIYGIVKQNSKKSGYKDLISKSEFVRWWNEQSQKCFYCGISLQELSLIKDNQNNRVKRLTIDKLNPKLGYIKENIVLSCQRCNNIKTDFFTAEEMKEIAQKYIKPKWEFQFIVK